MAVAWDRVLESGPRGFGGIGGCGRGLVVVDEEELFIRRRREKGSGIFVVFGLAEYGTCWVLLLMVYGQL